MTCVLVGSVTVAELPNCVEPPASAFSQMGSDTHLRPCTAGSGGVPSLSLAEGDRP